jgi:hypothetical protein
MQEREQGTTAPQQPNAKRRRTNKIALIAAGTILAVFALIAALGAALHSGNTNATAAPHTAAPTATNSSTAANPLAPASARTKAAAVLNNAIDHYASEFATGRAIVGTTRYADANAGLAALDDPNSAASKFSAWRTSTRIEQDVTTYQDAFTQADAGFNPADEPAAMGRWRDDTATVQSDINAWIQAAVGYQISAATQSDLDAAAAKVAADLKTAHADVTLVQSGR